MGFCFKNYPTIPLHKQAMKKFLFLSLLLLSVTLATAQDLIITVHKDTIACHIKSISDTHIRYEQKSEGNFMIGKVIPLSEVDSYYRASRRKDNYNLAEPWLIRIGAGGAHLPWFMDFSTDATSDENYPKLTNGYQLSTSAHYLFSPRWGAGLHYSHFSSGYKGDYYIEIDPFYPMFTDSYQREQIYMNYAGASLLYQLPLGYKKKLMLTGTLSAGPLFFRMESEVSYAVPVEAGYGYEYGYVSSYVDYKQSYLVEGITIGAGVGLSVNYQLQPRLSLGLAADFLAAKLNRADVYFKDNQQNTQERQNEELGETLRLSRLNYSIQLRFSL